MPANIASNAELPSARPRVSVVVPTRNRPRELQRCLEALVAQRCGDFDFEVIVVDDGSDPVYQAEVDSLQKRFPAVRFERVAHGGPARARNRGVSLAHGVVVAFTDDDCRAHPEWLANLAA